MLDSIRPLLGDKFGIIQMVFLLGLFLIQSDILSFMIIGFIIIYVFIILFCTKLYKNIKLLMNHNTTEDAEDADGANSGDCAEDTNSELQTLFIDMIGLKRETKRVVKTDTKRELETPEYAILRKKIDNAIVNDLQHEESCDNESLRKMLLYALEGGKRVRTVIMLSLNPDIDIDKLLAIEYLHASSLIIDDIMDGDKDRRGKKCLHVLYDNTLAQMTAIYLLSLSMKKVAKFSHPDSNDNKEFAQTFNELCMGQFMDVDNKSYDVEKLIKYKTSVLFQLSYYLASPADTDTNNTNNTASDYKKLGLLFGDIFQISDDYDDKGKDKAKNNVVLTKGKTECRKLLDNKIQEYKSLAKDLNADNYMINHIIDFLNYKTLS